jgi:hypothetical protein
MLLLIATLLLGAEHLLSAHRAQQREIVHRETWRQRLEALCQEPAVQKSAVTSA